VGDLHDIHRADVSFAALNPSDVRPMQFRSFGESFLRPAELQPAFSYRFAEFNAGIRLHLPILGR
jgi:hypothetical protein